MANTFKNLIAEIDVPVVITDSSLNIVNANELFYRIVGDSFDHSVLKLIHEVDFDNVQACIARAVSEQKSQVMVKMLYSDNDYHCVFLEMTFLSEKQLFEIRAEDSLKLKSSIKSLRFENKKLKAVLDISNEVVFEYNFSNEIISFNIVSDIQSIRLYSEELDDWKNRMLSNKRICNSGVDTFEKICDEIKAGKESFSYRLKSSIITKGNNYDWNKVVGKTIVDADGNRLVIGTWNIYNELTQSKVDHLLDDIFKDPLTGLLNKREITKLATTLVEKKPDYNLAFLLIDIDNFKNINDNFGHMFGDEVITGIAEIIKSTVGSHGICGRIGGDEFLAVIENYSDEPELRNFLRAIKTNVQWLFKEKLGGFEITCSIGVSSYPQNAKSYEELFLIADKTLYISKAKGKNRYIIYRPELHGPLITKSDDERIIDLKTGTSLNDNIIALSELLGRVSDSEAAILPLLELLSKIYMIDRINIFSGEDMRCRYSFNPNGYPFGDGSYIFDEKYQALFDSTGLFILDNVHLLEFSKPSIHINLTNQDVRSVMQYVFRNNSGHIIGFISFDRCIINRIWTPESINMLIIACKMLEKIILSL